MLREGLTMTDADRCYFERRAEQEIAMAAATEDPSACARHYELANLYLSLISETPVSTAA